MNSKETLQEALERTGDDEHVEHLNKQAKNLTKRILQKC